MARDFNGSTGTLSKAVAVASSLPVTIAGWYNTDTTASSQTIASIGTNGGTARYHLAISSSGPNILAQATNTAGSNGNASAGTPTTGTWQHAAAVFATTTSRTAYFNGVAGTPNTTSVTVSGADETRIAARYNSGSLGLFFDGRLAYVAIWNADLTAAEIAMLAAGVSPLLIRPASLVSYCPIFGAVSPESDLIQATKFTLAGTAPQAQSIGLIMPARPRLIFPALGGTTVTGTMAADETADTFAGDGTVTNTGTMAATEAPDTFAGEGSIINSGTMAATETPDVFAGEGVVLTPVTGTMAATETPDVFAGEGTVDGGEILDSDVGRKKRRRKPVIEVSSEWEPVPRREEPRVILPDDPEPAPPQTAVPSNEWFPVADQVVLRPSFAPVDEETRMAVEHYIRLRQEDDMILRMLGLQ